MLVRLDVSVDPDMQQLITPGSLSEHVVEHVDQLEVMTQFVPWKIEPNIKASKTRHACSITKQNQYFLMQSLH